MLSPPLLATHSPPVCLEWQHFIFGVLKSSKERIQKRLTTDKLLSQTTKIGRSLLQDRRFYVPDKEPDKER